MADPGSPAVSGVTFVSGLREPPQHVTPPAAPRHITGAAVAVLWALAGAWVVLDAVVSPARMQTMLWMFAATVLFIALASSALIGWYVVRFQPVLGEDVRHATEIGFESGRRYERDLWQDGSEDPSGETNVFDMKHIAPPPTTKYKYRLGNRDDSTSSSG